MRFPARTHEDAGYHQIHHGRQYRDGQAQPHRLQGMRTEQAVNRIPPDATGGQHRAGCDLLDDLRPQHDRADLAAVAAALAALGDDDVDIGLGVLAGLGR